MNKKTIAIIAGILTINVILYIAYVIVSVKNKDNEAEKDIFMSEETVEDDCMKEYMEENLAQTTSANEEKVAANAILILKKYYAKCDHTINEYVELPKELVNMTKNEVEEQYPEWKVIGFSSGKITLYKEFDESCNEHFKLKIEDGKVVIYKMNEDGKEDVYEKTNISSEYLTDTDLINIQNGLEVYGQEELNKVIEDFE